MAPGNPAGPRTLLRVTNARKAIEMYRLTTLVIAMTLGATGFAAAQEAPVYGLDYNPPIVRTGHDSKPKHYGAPGQVRSDAAGSRADIGGAIDTRTTASIMARPAATARAGALCRPPSEKLSGVTLRMPMMTG